ncbi:MAG TPA: MlaD family protein [Desulfobaccales bacterium]|nr:MlaD family protein [Desulfobaccales bacterium]
MAKQANRMMIGGFVVLAVIIMAASLVVFGSGKFFQKTVKCVMYFDESVKGLSVGAPVLFQGVQIGSVVSMVLQVDPINMKTQIPVIIEYAPEKFQLGEEGQKTPRDPRKSIPRLIEKGLRAQLGMQSYITGQLIIELDFYPDKPATLKSIEKTYIEIPTIPSTSAKLAEALEKLDLEALGKHLELTLAGVDQFINNPDLAVSIRALKDTLQDARKLVTRVDRQVDPLANDVKKTVKKFGKLASNVDGRVGGLVAGFDKSMSGFDTTMSAAKGVLSQDSPLMVELENALKEISAMSRSIRQLTDYLDQHPEALIRGKGNPGGK